jgi:hypothetical protein
LIANFVAVNAKNIGLNKYEGHSLYDVIYGNKTDISIDMVTGDNHSINKLNFVILDSIDVDYVPSIKDIREAANNLYSVKTPDNYTGIITSKGVIDKNLIKAKKEAYYGCCCLYCFKSSNHPSLLKGSPLRTDRATFMAIRSSLHKAE